VLHMEEDLHCSAASNGALGDVYSRSGGIVDTAGGVHGEAAALEFASGGWMVSWGVWWMKTTMASCWEAGGVIS